MAHDKASYDSIGAAAKGSAKNQIVKVIDPKQATKEVRTV